MRKTNIKIIVSWSSLRGYKPLITPSPFPREFTWKYNSMLTYILVSFFPVLFSFKNFVPVTVKNRVRIRVSSRVRVWLRVRVQGSGSDS